MFDPSDASTKTGGQDPARAEEETIRILTDPGSWTNSGLDAGDGAKRPETSGDADSWKLRPGSRVAVIGGGPAGSLFAQFLLKTTAHLDIDIDVDIYEPRDFNFCGPAGCNHCGGVVSESLIQLLGTEGVVLPEQVIQRGIDSYVMHMDVGSVQIETPLREKRIAAVYRGNGPRQSEPASVGRDHGPKQRDCDANRTPAERGFCQRARPAGQPLAISGCESEAANLARLF